MPLAPANFLSGILAGVLVNGNEYRFKKWRIPIQTGLPKVNNFTSAFQLLVTGLTKATIYLEGPYDAGNMPMTSGNEYTITLQWSASLALVVTANIGELLPDDDVEDAARIQVTFESNGSFTPSVT